MHGAGIEAKVGRAVEERDDARDAGAQALQALFLALRLKDERASTALARIARQFDLAALAVAG